MATLAMTQAGYIAFGWIASFAVLGAYAFRTIRRGRALARVVPAEEQRWS